MRRVIILGAGMAGISAALHLQERGHAVTVVDRLQPGQATSYGNAGIIQAEAVKPYAMPRDLNYLFKIIARRTNDTHYQSRYLPANIGPVMRYWWHSAPDRHRKSIAAHAKLISRAVTAHAEWIKAAGCEHLIRRDGYRILYRSAAALEQAEQYASLLGQEFDVPYKVLSAGQLQQAEPGLINVGAGAVHWLSPWTIRDPGALVAAYAQLFQQRGGTVLRGDAETLQQADNDDWTISTADGVIKASDVVLSLGPWSGSVMAGFGQPVPMLLKRGYHRHFANENLDLPLMDAANGYVMAPMAQGLRITTGAELSSLDAPADPVQLQRAEQAARQLLPLEAAREQKPWFGTRPCMPDMLPVIGRASRARGLWTHFGHGHQGVTLGPVTGEILADLMSGTTPRIDPTPFSPDRL